MLYYAIIYYNYYSILSYTMVRYSMLYYSMVPGPRPWTGPNPRRRRGAAVGRRDLGRAPRPLSLSSPLYDYYYYYYYHYYY